MLICFGLVTPLPLVAVPEICSVCPAISYRHRQAKVRGGIMPSANLSSWEPPLLVFLTSVNGSLLHHKCSMPHHTVHYASQLPRYLKLIPHFSNLEAFLFSQSRSLVDFFLIFVVLGILSPFS